MARAFSILPLLLLALGLAVPGAAQTVEKENPRLGPSGLPVPRFVSLSAGKAFMRAGPGEQYPIQWVYKKPGLPLLVSAEFDAWRKVRDSEGTEGWMHVVLLSGERTALVTGKVRDFHEEPSRDARIVFRAEPGVTGELLECRQGWCRIEAAGHKGWAPAAHIWGAFTGEEFE